MMIENEELTDRDALGVTRTNNVSLRAISKAKLIVIDVPADLL